MAFGSRFNCVEDCQILTTIIKTAPRSQKFPRVVMSAVQEIYFINGL